MTKFKQRSAVVYHKILVEPDSEFCPKNWRDRPANYRVVEHLGTQKFLGSADAWRFLHNQREMESARIERWAILVG